MSEQKNTKVFKTDIVVRGYELDGYGHVNNAVYLNYAEYARWCMIEDSGAGDIDYFKMHEVSPVLVRAEVDYKEPCLLAERLFVETKLVELKTRMAKFQQKIFKKETKRLAAEITVTLLCVNTQGRAVSLPSDFEKHFGSPNP